MRRLEQTTRSAKCAISSGLSRAHRSRVLDCGRHSHLEPLRVAWTNPDQGARRRGDGAAGQKQEQPLRRPAIHVKRRERVPRRAARDDHRVCSTIVSADPPMALPGNERRHAVKSARP